MIFASHQWSSKPLFLLIIVSMLKAFVFGPLYRYISFVMFLNSNPLQEIFSDSHTHIVENFRQLLHIVCELGVVGMMSTSV